MALTGHITTVQEPGEPAPIPHAEPQQQGPNTPGKHWKAALHKVGRRRAELRAEKITRPGPGQGPRAAERQGLGLMLLHRCRAVTSAPQFTGIRQALNFPNLQELGSETVQSPALCMSHPFRLHRSTQGHQKPA